MITRSISYKKDCLRSLFRKADHWYLKVSNKPRCRTGLGGGGGLFKLWLDKTREDPVNEVEN